MNFFIQDLKEMSAKEEGYTLDLRYMQSVIGGSSLDDLRDMMGLKAFTFNEDILFKVVDSSDEGLAEYVSLPAGKTYRARCTALDSIPDHIMFMNKDFASWKPV